MSKQKPYILIVEDEPKIAQLLADYLVADGMQCEVLDDGRLVEASVRAAPPDLIVLDLMLPGLDGLSVCRVVRGFCAAPIIMLTARVDEIDRIVGLEMGADDYVCKPFSAREVVARVRAQLRRQGGMLHAAEVSPLSLDGDRFEARIRGQLVPLTVVEFRLLAALAQRPGVVYTREHLMQVVYADHRIVNDRTVDSHVRNLRRKLSEFDPTIDPIRAIYGVGYKLDWDQPPAEG